MDPAHSLSLDGQVNRRALDFDFDPVCSQTLATTGIYVCLACGKFLQGRMQGTPAHLHALHHSPEHGLYIHLASGRAHRLPEDFEVDDGGRLDDIRQAIYPTFNGPIGKDLVRGTDLHGKEYVAGFLGLNNIRCSDYANVTIRLLSHLPPLRDALLATDLRTLPAGPLSTLLQALGLTLRRLWHPSPFKASLSPQALLQAVRSASSDRFLPTARADPADLLAWLLHALERAMAAAALPPVLPSSLKGSLRQASSRVLLDTAMRNFYDDVAGGRWETRIIPYYFLALDLPPVPLFQDHTGKRVIPQASLLDLLRKYDGTSVSSRGGTEHTYCLLSTPPYLILHLKRLLRTEFGDMEKNRTVVNFSLTDLQLGGSRYSLLANISHEGDATDGQYLIHTRHPCGTWFEARDLEIREIHPQTIFLTDTYIQLWQRTDH